VKAVFQVAVHTGTQGLSSIARAVGAAVTDAMDSGS
jgi:hypothetical protein